MSTEVTQGLNTTAPGTEVEPLAKCDAHQLLGNERRYLIVQLLSENGTMSKRELVDHVAARENDTTPEELTSDERKRVHVSIHQQHLRKLEDAGVISRDRSEIGFGPNACFVVSKMEDVGDSDSGLLSFFRR